MSTQIEICNMALSHLGTGVAIQSIDERSQEAKVLKQFWQIALDSFCTEFSFPHTRRYMTLELVEEDPTSEWKYSYRYPNNCLQIKRILSGCRNDTHESRVPYKESSDSSGRLILTDQRDAEVEFVAPVTNVSFFSESWALALSYKLSYLISPRLTGGNAFTGITEMMLKLYMRQSALAQSIAANEVQPDVLPESEFILSRN